MSHTTHAPFPTEPPLASPVVETGLRLLAWTIAHLLYRVRARGLEDVPAEGPGILVCNHVSFVDWLIIAAMLPRVPRFVMYQGFARIPIARIIFRYAQVIPIASQKEDSEALAKALERVSAALEAGDLVCIFPEGQLTQDGEVGVFRSGVERMLARNPVPVVPMALTGLWGSFFSRVEGAPMRHPFRRRPWARVGLEIGRPIAPDDATAARLRDEVLALRGDRR